jgi:hypothetical protein
MVDLGGQVCDERLESPAFLRPAQVFEGMRQLDSVLKKSTLALGC